MAALSMRSTTPKLLGILFAIASLAGCYGGRDADSAGQDSEDGTADGGSSASDGGTDTDGDDGPDDPDDAVGPFDCDPNAIMSSVNMRRLSRVQYENSLRDLLTWVGGEETSWIMDDLEPQLGRMPNDARLPLAGETRGGFRRMDQDVHQEHIDASYEVAAAAARFLTDPGLMEITAGTCATDGDASNDNQCVEDFIRGFGEQALKRPVTDDEVAFYREVFDAEGVTVGMAPEAFADVISVLLTAPQFLYMVEHGAAELADQPGVFELDEWELASRMSYHFWQTAPDAALRESARSGDILTDAGYEAQIDRLLADPRAEQAVQTFAREWMWLEDLPPMDAQIGRPVYDAFRGGFEPTPETTQNMVREIEDMTAYYALATDATFDEYFTSNRSFARTDDLAEIYGVQTWDGGEPPTFPDPERAGLITRAGLLATGNANTRPVMKGLFIRKALLCDPIAPPPPDADTTPPELDGNMTTREVLEALTEQEGSVCQGCHGTLLNHLGFATENFDGLGRIRSEQTLIDEDGNITGTKAVDTASVPQVVLGDTAPSSGASDVTQMILESEKAQACFARHYLRFTWGRAEDLDTDGCLLNSLTVKLSEGTPLGEVLREIALRPEFKTRQIEE